MDGAKTRSGSIQHICIPGSISCWSQQSWYISLLIQFAHNWSTRQLSIGASHCLWGGYTNRIVCNIHGQALGSTALCEVCGSIYITYISVSKSTPLAVTGPHGQLASQNITKHKMWQKSSIFCLTESDSECYSMFYNIYSISQFPVDFFFNKTCYWSIHQGCNY